MKTWGYAISFATCLAVT